MKILIVDDQHAKAAELAKVITSTWSDVEIIHATNAQDGFRILSSGGIALILLDVVLPLGLGDKPTEEGSLWFVREVHRKISGPGLPLIVGTTQFAESLVTVQETFRNYLWCVVHIASSDDRWPRQIHQAVRFAHSNNQRISLDRSQESSQYDIGIVSALRTPEFSEIIDALRGGEKLVIGETNESWLKCHVERLDGRSLTVVAACADDMGMTAMSSLVTRLAITCRPKLLMLVGIMAGNKERVQLSDLVVVESTWDCKAGKLTDKGFVADVKSRDCSFKLANKVMAVLTEEFVLGFWKSWKGDRPQQIAKLHKGDVACSPAVIAQENAFAELERDQKRKILGLEMEAYGCYDAVRRLGDMAPEVVCLKSVCDFGDGEKNDKFQTYCAALAASAVVHVIKDVNFCDRL